MITTFNLFSTPKHGLVMQALCFVNLERNVAVVLLICCFKMPHWHIAYGCNN